MHLATPSVSKAEPQNRFLKFRKPWKTFNLPMMLSQDVGSRLGRLAVLAVLGNVGSLLVWVQQLSGAPCGLAQPS